MSPSARKPALVSRSVVELDLVGYSHVARDLEKQTDATVVFHLNDQVQSFVDDGLREAGCARKDVVNGTAGDNALLVFERASEAHRFSEAVHRATAKYNALKTDPAAHRHFRIGISTGEIAVRGKEISGARIIDSVRLEAAGKKGHILIDQATYEELPAKFQQCYRGPESVADKQNNPYLVYRFVVVESGDAAGGGHELVAAKKDSAGPRQISCPVDISRIIKYAPAELIGRETETELLNDAWEKAVRGETKRPHVLIFVALGGEGKTSLVAKWAADLAHQDWPGCDAVFAWSFYSQGTSEKTQASSDSFLKEALLFFGDEEMANSAISSFDKGRRLAQLIGERRALLILDGVEPLQYAPTSPTGSELKDQGVSALLKGLATNNDGLCVVTTRYSIPDLRNFWQTTATEIKLTSLSREAGVALLRTLGVKGTQQEFEQLVNDVKGHALTLNLLGSYLRDAHAGDIRKRDLVKLEEADAEEQSGHAFHVIDAYVKSFKDEGEKGRRALSILRLLGLFDRPATADCLIALWTGEEIGGLTGPLLDISATQRNITLKRLEDAGLITMNRNEGSELISLDAHPLLREYFSTRVREELPGAWRAAHRRLYEHLCATTKEGDEPTLEDLQPLYQAVAHGCQAGLHKETLYEVYHARILQRDEGYSVHTLGAFGSDLGAIASFFETPWNRISPSLNKAEHAWMLNEAAYRLRALGRLTEALGPVRTGLQMSKRLAEDATDEKVRLHHWRETAIYANNLSEMELSLGHVGLAVRDGEESVLYSNRSGEFHIIQESRCTFADALHNAGRGIEAAECFRETEELTAKGQPSFPLLCSLRGFRFCDLLLTDAERTAWHTTLRLKPPHSTFDAATVSCNGVSERAAQTLRIAQSSHWVLDTALDYLSMSRAFLYTTIIEDEQNKMLQYRERELEQKQHTGSILNIVVAGFLQAGTRHWIPAGLLTRAWLRFLEGEQTGPESAQSDLDEALEIAERGPMRLFMADIYLYRARLFHGVTPYPWNIDANGKPRGPKDDLASARKLIEQCGYWRRKEELEDAEEAAKNW